ncbi:8931_t:CDS:2 [Entrophospora sp. SA101]|nr:8931_t:CDS:2 [Entrophospora sp. SA101]CAJ0846363.1 3941_t:CDS:2 [Entrophospora sp. SA101]
MKHKAAEQKHKNNPQPLQSSLFSFTNNDRDKINIAIIEAFTKADIPLDKIDKLKRLYCRFNQLQEKYLPMSYEFEVQKLNFLCSVLMLKGSNKNEIDISVENLQHNENYEYNPNDLGFQYFFDVMCENNINTALQKEKIVNYECDTDEEDLDYDSHNFLEKGVKNNIDLYGSNDESSDKDDDIEINEDKEKKSKNTSRKRIKKNYKD